MDSSGEAGRARRAGRRTARQDFQGRSRTENGRAPRVFVVCHAL